MDNLLFDFVKEKVTQWLIDNDEKFKSKHINTEIVKNEKECLYVILEYGEYMASIVVAKPDFAPYHFVSFELAAMVSGVSTISYSWYDKEGNTIEEIIKNLDRSLNYVMEYSHSKGTT